MRSRGAALSRALRRLGLLLSGLYALYVAVLLCASRTLMFPGASAGRAPPVRPGLERWTLPVEDGEVEALFQLGRGRSPASPGPAVVFAHGNAESVDDWLGVHRGYLEAGVSVLLVEYRGYGRSTGSATAKNLAADAVRSSTNSRTVPRSIVPASSSTAGRSGPGW